MADPHTPMGQIKFANEESENDRSLDSCESPPDPYPQRKRKQSSAPHDKDYIPKEEVYKH
jgi:hypothetical protein